MKRRLTSLAVLFFAVAVVAFAAPQQQMVRVIVTPDRADWTYHVGEKPVFLIQVLRFGNPLAGARVHVKIGPEKMDPVKEFDLVLKDGTGKVGGVTMKEPGFLRCWASVKVEGHTYTGLATAGLDPDKIEPTTTLPKDFREFWETGKRELEKIPLDAEMTLLPDRCTSKVNVYHVSFANIPGGDSRIYGILCVPKGPDKYPAILKVPGAGVRPYYGQVALAERGVITLEIGIHGIPVTYDRRLYNNLRWGALQGYWFYNLDDRDRYYYRRVYLGCVRAVDFIFSLPQFDGETLAVTGGSQGGALTIITASLDPRVKWLAAYYPALCDLTGYLHGRAGGWPHMFNKANKAFNVKPDKIETSKYYDVVNFARFVNIPGRYAWGFNDTTCPPTSMYAAYNVIPGPKELWLYQDTGHWTYPEERERMENWLIKQVKGQ